ncbi:putative NADH:ubiquinone oxidoreductase, subunit RnfC [Desulfitobacterium dehalogenans ATCC 51507]|uniref:Putative NADH:ubiquinone oxidoreductase, subunit RnfC n=1 Tax=Desulfitobacterium dehalogenans (strain ATCC 51507 / DSM 9161 / JW/IU-DC1) TaxID=756499 RepID=I4A4E3_DESDJ|nr:4Fe-4S dicluster domain-containing protein [Desulfitobacterium dehalogenans]AFL98827.1 putative NADH:ubiquinone oxidoreductase, subunit RnfC [Desulfitobacterium dehalogenans ATCC 51507]
MREELIQKIKEAGVVGAGGAGFPTHVKVAAKAQIVIVNGAECEPLLRVDQQLMASQAAKVVMGLEIVMSITGAGEGIIALKSKYKDAIAALEKEIAGKPIRIHILNDFYPAGDEHLIVYESTGRLIPQGGIPLKVDCIVNNVETLINIVDAVAGKPVTDTYLTITGEVNQPMTIKLPIGTSIIAALGFAGYHDLEHMKIIEGGPMMGNIVDDVAQPITKTTKGLILLPQDHPLIKSKTLPSDKVLRQSRVSCMQCRYCTDLCPRYLLGHKIEPHKMMLMVKHLQGDENTMKMAFSCSECGVCEQYACIMGLSPRAVNAMLKHELSKMGIKPDPSPANRTVDPLRKHRKIPIKRLISRLALTQYDQSAPLNEQNYPVHNVAIKLCQHIGAPCKPSVKVGSKVKKGDAIAFPPTNGIGACLHASIDGVVKKITNSIFISSSEGSEK